MRVTLKLNDIEQEHLQELYDAAGVARDELPYTEQFDRLCQGFQDRTFKNADPEQVFGAVVKYVRSSTCASGATEGVTLNGEQVAQLRQVLRRHLRAGRIMPYSSEFDMALKEFAAAATLELTPRDFWLAVRQAQGRSQGSRKRATAKVAQPSDDDSLSEGE